MTDKAHETPSEADTAHLHEGERITLDELAVHLSAIDLRLRQLARVAEMPATPVELTDTIDSLRFSALQMCELGGRMALLARIVDGDVPLGLYFPSGDPWGAAALDTDREDFGGPAVIPTQWQLLKLATDGQRDAQVDGRETTTYPKGMDGVPRSLLNSWESKAASARRRRERDAAVKAEVLLIECGRCHAGSGQQCRTTGGWAAEQAHTGRQREAEARVDARLGYLGDNPVAVPDA